MINLHIQHIRTHTHTDTSNEDLLLVRNCFTKQTIGKANKAIYGAKLFGCNLKHMQF